MATTSPKNSAVIVVDMARDFIEPGGFIANAGGSEYQAKARAIIGPLKRLLDAALEAGATAVYSTDCHTPEDAEMKKWPPHSMKGTEWADIVSEITPEPSDLVLPKTTYSGFQSSNLEAELKSRDIEDPFTLPVFIPTAAVGILPVTPFRRDSIWSGSRMRCRPSPMKPIKVALITTRHGMRSSRSVSSRQLTKPSKAGSRRYTRRRRNSGSQLTGSSQWHPGRCVRR